jgi:WD40-like Beta Propeller Repeat
MAAMRSVARRHILEPSLSAESLGGIEEGDQIEFPRWSPDGTRIAYTDADGIHVVDVSTGEASLVAEGGASDWFGDDTLVVVP